MGRIVVIHPDLGLGGAERLIVDASKALQDCGHEVTIYTGYHDTSRCFEETRNGTLRIITIGKWIPRNIFGKCHALMAYLRMMFIALYLIIFSRHDLILCDQVSACIPILKLDFKNKSRIIFYCHFPDQLLTTRTTLLKTLYRKPIDLFESWSTSLSDLILVNSNFTSKIVKQTFSSLKDKELQILYPCVELSKFVHCKSSFKDYGEQVQNCELLARHKFIFLSLNRFERKKDLRLAIEALAECFNILRKMGEESQSSPISGGGENLHLILAGGYDERLSDCLDYYSELEQLVKELNIESSVTFVKSPKESEKLQLFRSCNAVIYTPENEHFGIVPLEAMAMLRPVIASSSGGPLETIEHGRNGLLCDHDRWSFAKAMLMLYQDHDLSVRMGVEGFERVNERFSYEAFRDSLNKICFPSH